MRKFSTKLEYRTNYNRIQLFKNDGNALGRYLYKLYGTPKAIQRRHQLVYDAQKIEDKADDNYWCMAVEVGLTSGDDCCITDEYQNALSEHDSILTHANGDMLRATYLTDFHLHYISRDYAWVDDGKSQTQVLKKVKELDQISRQKRFFSNLIKLPTSIKEAKLAYRLTVLMIEYPAVFIKKYLSSDFEAPTVTKKQLNREKKQLLTDNQIKLLK